MPVADGGDGLVAVLLARRGGRLVRARVRGPLGENRLAEYALLADGLTAVIEMARASGLALVAPGRRDPLGATTFGTGQLVADALRRGRRRILVGLGGSAANDGGAGFAAALGARLLDADGRGLPLGAEALARLAKVETSELRRRLGRAVVIGISDVTNPLLGPRGSARVYGPQKGATPAQVGILERALARWAGVVGRRAAGLPGAGAAGGLGFALAAFCGARLVNGAEWVLGELGAAGRLRRASLLVTGEGSVDASSFFGKAPVALLRLAGGLGRPAAVVCGRLEPGAGARLRRAGAGAIEVLSRPGEADAAAMRAARARLPLAAERLGRALLAVVLLAPAAFAETLAEADALYFRRDRPGALERSNAALEARVEAAPDDAEALWRLARGLVRAGERKGKGPEALALFDRAEDLAGRAVSLSSATAEAWFMQGLALGRRGEARGMMRSLFMIKPMRRRMEAALALDPKHAGAHHVLGELYWQVPAMLGGSKAGALKELEAALAADPSYTGSYSTLAAVYLAAGRKVDAQALLERIQKVDRPADPVEYPYDVAELKKILAGS